MNSSRFREYLGKDNQIYYAVYVYDNGVGTISKFTDKKEARAFQKSEYRRIVTEKFGEFVTADEIKQAMEEKSLDTRTAAAMCGYSYGGFMHILKNNARGRKKKLGPLFDFQDNRTTVGKAIPKTCIRKNQQNNAAKYAKEAKIIADDIRTRMGLFPQDWADDIDGMLLRLDRIAEGGQV